MTETFHTSDGARIGYRVLGREHAGPALVMVNGMSAVMEDWLSLAHALAETRRVVVLDHRGIGASYLTPDESEDISIELMAQDVIDLVRSLGVRIVHLLGFSMGGLIVQAILTHANAQATADGKGVAVQGIEVRRVVLSATFTRSPRTEFRLEDVPRPAHGSSADRAKAAVRYMLEMQYDPAVLGPGGALEATLEAHLAESATLRRPAMLIMQQATAISLYSGRDALCRVPHGLPVAVIHGRRDRMVAYDESADLLARLPGAVRLFPATDARDREAFGHMWFDYFALRAWVAPLTQFLYRPGAKI
ncbi:hypothetical protein MCAP1_003354 [Malassezia caprae]|uniref:AB hydrolase-1 domain-containing protein n=1 Tax=Malassezia caprae TaxID=1381934 RepID=A0AAF0IXJ3_9BASI|nr:hypothetical protein MCAP1_003354 [Malassezia caprae]